jgi:hypothetical protein
MHLQIIRGAVSYFERQLKSDIIKYAGKWLLEEFDELYDPYSGITNKFSFWMF